MFRIIAVVVGGWRSAAALYHHRRVLTTRRDNNDYDNNNDNNTTVSFRDTVAFRTRRRHLIYYTVRIPVTDTVLCIRGVTSYGSDFSRARPSARSRTRARLCVSVRGSWVLLGAVRV